MKVEGCRYLEDKLFLVTAYEKGKTVQIPACVYGL